MKVEDIIQPWSIKALCTQYSVLPNKTWDPMGILCPINYRIKTWRHSRQSNYNLDYQNKLSIRDTDFLSNIQGKLWQCETRPLLNDSWWHRFFRPRRPPGKGGVCTDTHRCLGSIFPGSTSFEGLRDSRGLKRQNHFALYLSMFSQFPPTRLTHRRAFEVQGR